MTSGKVVIWLDDERNPSTPIWSKYIKDRVVSQDSIIWAKNRSEFENAFLSNLNNIEAVFFDNDLGSIERGQEGKDCFNWMENYIWENDLNNPFAIFVQSSNTSAKNSMLLGIQALKKYWSN